MRALPAFLAAVAAELLAYFLSVSWGLALLVLAFLWVAAGTAAKTRATEARIAPIVTTLGAHLTLINNAQGTANTANTTANNAYNAANNAQSSANNAQNTANGCLPTAGGTVTGNMTVDGNLTIHGGTSIGGQNVNIPQARGGGMAAASGTYSQTEVNSIVTEVTQINQGLVNAGIFT
jgi:Alanine-zipper, major outer membrane lipoprotein